MVSNLVGTHFSENKLHFFEKKSGSFIKSLLNWLDSLIKTQDSRGLNSTGFKIYRHTVDGYNPAPVDIKNIP